MKHKIMISIVFGITISVCASSSGSASMSSLLDTLCMSDNQEEARRMELEQAVVDLKAKGDEAVDAIMASKHLKKVILFRQRAIPVLAEIGTAKAQQALLDIALDHRDRKDSFLAAKYYVEIIRNKGDARKLLASENPPVLDCALRTLKGQPIDADLLGKLRPLLMSKKYYLCMRGAAVIQADPNVAYVEEKVSAILEAIGTVEQFPDANQLFPNPHFMGTIADFTYCQFIESLSGIQGADDYLRQIPDGLTGKAYWCVIIARAKRGDTDVKTKLYKIINDPSAKFFRCYAVRSLWEIGTKDDLSFLENLKLTDSWVTEVNTDIIDMTGKHTRTIYPVRMEAELAIRAIENKK